MIVVSKVRFRLHVFAKVEGLNLLFCVCVCVCESGTNYLKALLCSGIFHTSVFTFEINASLLVIGLGYLHFSPYPHLVPQFSVCFFVLSLKWPFLVMSQKQHICKRNHLPAFSFPTMHQLKTSISRERCNSCLIKVKSKGQPLCTNELEMA